MQLTLSHTFPPHRPSCRAALVMDRFGIGPETTRHVIADNLEIPLQPGDIVCFLGPSGSGKSSLLRAAAGQLNDTVWLDRLDLGDALVIDGLGLPADAAFELLTRCGLGEPRLMLRTPAELSDGERFRCRLARSAALQPAWLVADEFTAILDRTLAKVVAFNLRRLARRSGFGGLLATTHEDILDDLQPDLLIRGDLTGQPTVERRERQLATPISFADSLQTSIGSAADWPPFARWHYRGHDIACIRFVTVLRHGDRPVGICVFAAPARSLRGRNRFFGLSGRWSRAQLQAQSAQLVTLSRVVLHPTYRGAGLASAFVRASCRLCPFPWIETLAEMGRLHPLFERAGFVRVDVAAGKRSLDGHSELYGKGRHGRGRLVTAATHDKSRWTAPVYYIYDNRSAGRRSAAAADLPETAR
ncbi:ATP-binding cassette domain-containing protein [Planctellipticum variicoloris]|uniref:ATP-binding cassette domain-containing protein n=1 Tax=Planctellipticum variicoloris TaxID=3064265 RepID=UPI0030138E8A|nr:ATP-binding cassette domain-containing protein [Planctomycetaceae bacterium SH412]